MYDEIFRENGYHRSKRVRYELTLKSQRNVIHGGNLTWKFSACQKQQNGASELIQSAKC